jgi:GT2 family glycosyltransferase
LIDEDYPTVSIVTVNYNGKRFLKSLFNSISNLDYPKEKIQVIMVDNGSIDGSVDFVRRGFPQVKIISLSKNVGYAGGNNAAFKKSTGDYIALINNDCIVDKHWLKKMVETMSGFEESSHCAVVSPKVLFFYNYLPLKFRLNGKLNKNINLNISNVEVIPQENNSSYLELNNSIKYLDGFIPHSRDKNGDISEWGFEGSAVLAVPIPDMGKDFTLSFSIFTEYSIESLTINLEKEVVYDSGFLMDQQNKNIEVILSKDLFIYKKDLINSCGAEINKSFYSRDRGYLQFDNGQFNKIEEVFSPSGSSLLIDEKLLYDIGYFDEGFFTYYEDIDLFWRARLKGWRIFYTPDAVVRHYHCGTGKEWSYSFTYHVLRNRIIMIFKCGWLKLVVRSYLALIYSIFLSFAHFFSSLLKGQKQRRTDMPIRIRIFFELFYIFPKNFIKRLAIRSQMKLKDTTIKNWFKEF